MSKRGYAVVATAGILLAGVASVPAHAADVGCSEMELRDAITASNGMMGGDTLELTSYCVYTLTDAHGSLPTVIEPLVIQGHNATIRRDPAAATQFRIFQVGETSLKMDTLTVMNGDAGGGFGGGVELSTPGASLDATDVNFQGNAGEYGGGIEAGPGTTLSLTRGTISDNHGNSGGGGIDNTDADAVTLDSVTVTRNRTGTGTGIGIGDVGGGMYLDTVTSADITNSTFSNNTAETGGGGLFISDTTSLSAAGVKVTDNRVTNSTAGGGGLLVDLDSTSNVLTFTDSTISGNTLTDSTGGVAEGDGGGILLAGGAITLDGSTVRGNKVVAEGASGGGIGVQGGDGGSLLTLRNGTTITGNLASGRNAQGGGLHVDNSLGASTVDVNSSHIDANKVTGTGSVSGGVYNHGGTLSFSNASSVNSNIAPNAPAPGGVYTTVAIPTVDGATTFTGNTPTNCLLSPAAVTNCTN
ncbi:hypothetical protein [Streptomyces sp. NPDC086787]|uniref:hypothetical protein n=1 Tax=Streptomyces sp. NPDC086787 TaxID=3365759 RepID=UPI003815BB28